MSAPGPPHAANSGVRSTEASVSPLLTGLTWLLVFQCIGEVLVRATGAPVPGPVVGMVLLLFALLRCARGAARSAARPPSPPASPSPPTGC